MSLALALCMGSVYAADASPVAAAAPADPSVPAREAGDVTVRSVSWQGASLALTDAVLKKETAALAGQRLGVVQLDALGGTLSGQLRHAGLPVARVLVVDADREAFLRTGELRLSVFEGRVGAITLRNDSRVSDGLLNRTATRALCPDGVSDGTCVLQSGRLERMALLMQDVPGVKVDPVDLSPGAATGQTAVGVHVEQSVRAVSGTVGVDDFGVPSTGVGRLNANVQANNLLHVGDVVQADAAVTNRHEFSGDVGVSAPLGYLGVRGQASYSHMLFSLPEVNTRGSADVGSVGLSYPLVRGLDRNWTVAIDGLDTISRETVDGQEAFAPRHLFSGRITLSGNSGDRPILLGGSYWSALVALTHGRVSQGIDAADPSGVLGAYDKLAFNALDRLDLGSSGFYTLVNLRGQYSDRNLDPSEKLAAGGQGGVRAFRADEGSLDEGVLLTLELRRLFAMTNGIQVAPGIFADYANGRINHSPYDGWQTSNGYVDASLSNHRSLAAIGVGVDMVTPSGVSASLTWATRFPGSADSANYPGSAKNRVYASLSYRF